MFRIVADPPPTLGAPERWSGDFGVWLSRLLNKDPDARASAAELQAHRFTTDPSPSPGLDPDPDPGLGLALALALALALTLTLTPSCRRIALSGRPARPLRSPSPRAQYSASNARPSGCTRCVASHKNPCWPAGA